MMRLVVVVMTALCAGSFVKAGGFLIYEHGATATGMANARTALADDVSALYYNPAAITELPGLQLQLGATGILPYIHYDAAGRPDSHRTYPTYENGHYVEKIVNDGENSTDAKLRGFTPIHLYASYRLEDTGVSVGFGLNNPFGLGTYWPGDWDGRFIATETEIQTFFAQPVVALDLAALAGFDDRARLSIAVGYNLVYGTARLARRTDLRVGEVLSLGEALEPEGELRMTGSGFGHGWNLAVYAKIPELISFGLSVRSGIDLSFSGPARFRFNSAGRMTTELLGMSVPDQTTGEVDIDLPWNMGGGLAFLGIDDLVVAVDVYVAFFGSYDELQVRFTCVEEGTCTESLNGDPLRKDWGKTWQFSAGAEYRLTDSWALRAGYAHASSPVPDETYDPALPDGPRNMFAAGIGFAQASWKLDLGYMLARWKGEKDNQVGEGDHINPEGKANGNYTTSTHILALSVSAWF